MLESPFKQGPDLGPNALLEIGGEAGIDRADLFVRRTGHSGVVLGNDLVDLTSRAFAYGDVLIEGGAGVTISGVTFKEVSGFPILVSGSKQVRIERVRIEDSGSRNAAGRNNTTGGILLEEGTGDFQVLNCELKNMRGNGIWTHSLYTSPRNANGLTLF